MSKCIFCKKENDGTICKHCLTKGAAKTGNAMKTGGEVAIKAIPVVGSIVSLVMAKGKFKTKS
ncbi:hypothetical protein [Clostridium celatum]|uniref:Uncharacterized protein n=1 Tax=Clostridium celatum DSM 1785 TaxID=545697 RepID=L1QJD2_9CLOT|nr:hypothetical protein [Clostridium celatum]EKY28083.1 hypothetical protein HMPREF0216_00925 [Clostridium celatum DSM 1785]